MSRSSVLVPTLMRGLLLVAGLSCAMSSLAVAGAVDPSGRLRGSLAEIVAQADSDTLIPISIVFEEQVDPALIASLANGPAARTRIIARLKSVASRVQLRLRNELSPLESAQRVVRPRGVWLTNVLGLEATPEVIRQLAIRPEIAWINHNPKRPVFTGQPPLTNLLAAIGASSSDAPIDWGTEKIGAARVWTELGITGRGVKVAVVDSGVCYDHPDIVQQIWINPGEDLDHDRVVNDPSDRNNVDDDGNGFIDDLIGWDFDQGDGDPRDTDSGHGSHCAGSVAGDGTSGMKAGVAPDAQIMAVRVGLTLSDEVDVWNGMEYAAENGADVISMSLGWAHSWDPDRATWRRNCETTVALGTTMIVAAGNEGGGNEPDNVRTPGDVPVVITIGATDSNDALASFSSLGPVTWSDVSGFGDYPYPPGLIKPNVSGPGVDTDSHNFCSGYTLLSGTSMATPHVAGVAALMLEADPSLSRNELAAVLESTAIDLGPAGRDNSFGAGRVDAYAAVYEANRRLRYVSHRIVDAGVDRGNGDLSLDVGEIAQVVVTLTNAHDTDTATSIVGSLRSETPGVTVLDNRASWPDLAPAQSAEPVGGGFSLRIDSPCFTDATLVLDVYDASGKRSRNRFTVRVGSPVLTVLFDDDAESNQGWTVSGTVTDGAWVRDVPKGTKSGLLDANPPIDASSDGTRAFVTGNTGNTANDDDVDGGETILTSATLAAAQYDTLTLSYARWYHRDGFPAAPPAEWFIVEASDDGGTSWVRVEQVLTRSVPWSIRTQALHDLIPLTDGLRLRVRVQDAPASNDSVIEGGLDEVTLVGDRIVCEPYLPPGLALPPAVGNSLLVSRQANHIHLTWMEPAPGGAEGPATHYDIDTATAIGAPLVTSAGSTRGEWWDIDAAISGAPLTLYRVVAANSSGRAAGDLP